MCNTQTEPQTLRYKNYVGSIEFSKKENLYFGKILGIYATVAYKGTDPESLKVDFEESVEEYLRLCAKYKITPEESILS